MNVIIEEEVLVPDVPIIEEEVLVPAIYQEVQRQYKLDPLWDSLEETPKNHIQMIKVFIILLIVLGMLLVECKKFAGLN